MSVETLSPLVEQWMALCADPRFQDLPYKVELTGSGKVLMSPASNDHGFLQVIVSNLLGKFCEGGMSAVEFAIETDDGIRAPDVVWCSDAWLREHRSPTVASTSPEICVELMSPSNSEEEMKAKRILYFARGCKEFILVGEDGRVRFFGTQGEMDASKQAAGFPALVRLP